MNKSNINIFLGLCTFLSIIGCTSLYPIKDHLIKKQPREIVFSTNYQSRNIFQLRIEQTTEFLPIGIETIIKNNAAKKIQLVSDFPFKNFQQVTTKQSEMEDPNRLIVEETYLYLDKFQNASLTKSKFQYGSAFYFITYPAIDKFQETTQKRKYYNDPKRLYTNVIRSIRVGYWFLENNTKLIMMFKNLDKNYSFYFGSNNNYESVEIKSLSHPYNLSSKRLEESWWLSLVLSWPEVVKSVDQNTLEELFKRIESHTTPIKLNNVLDLSGNSGLLFINLPESKIFQNEIVENKTDTLSRNVKEFSIGLTSKNPLFKRPFLEYEFYFGLHEGETINQYLFDNKVSFVD